MLPVVATQRRRPADGCLGILEPQDRDPRPRRAGRPPAPQAAPAVPVGRRPQPLLPARLRRGRVPARAAPRPGRPAPAAAADPRPVDGVAGGAAALRAAAGCRPPGRDPLAHHFRDHRPRADPGARHRQGLRLAQEADRLGVDLARSPVRRLILSGEPAGSIPQTKALIERLWGAKAGDTAGMTEIGTIMIFECSRQPGGTHIIEDHFIEEVIDPATAEPVGYGERGERVVTSFGRGIIPLLRYRTADLVAKVPASRCTCGRGFDLYEGGILGRVDDMKLVRGTNVYPRAVEGIVREFPAVEEFQLLLTREGHFDRIALRVEPTPGVTDEAWADMAERLAKALAEAHEGLRFEVERAAPGELPRFELKARRTVDRRDTPIGG